MQLSALDSSRQWDPESQRRFWNDWDLRHLREDTIGLEALRRGQVALNLIHSLNLQRPHILEIGCGNGWLAEQLQAIGTVHGVDISDAAIEEARRRVSGAVFEAGDILSMDLPKGSFDVVVSLETLSHVADQRRFVNIAADTLRRQGHLVLATQNRIVYLRKGGIQPPAEGQIRRWVTKRELSQLLRMRFDCLRLFTIEPSGNKGVFRILNSRKLNLMLQRVFSPEAIQKRKEQLGLGQTIVALAKKRS